MTPKYQKIVTYIRKILTQKSGRAICENIYRAFEICPVELDISRMYRQCLQTYCAEENLQSICKFIKIFQAECPDRIVENLITKKMTCAF